MNYLKKKRVIPILLLSIICVHWARSDILDAKKYYEFSDYDNCLIELKRILKLNKTSVDAYRLYQDVMLDQDHFPDLLKEFEEKVKKNPDDYLSNYLYGRILAQDLYSYDLAERYLRKAIEINPKFPWSYMPLAGIYYSKDNFVEGINVLEECLRKCGNFIPSYSKIVKLYRELYGMDKAIQLLEKYLARSQGDLELSLLLADYYCKKNEIKKAETLLEKIKKIYKNDYRYHRIIYSQALCTNSNKIKRKLLEFYWKNYPDSILILTVYRNLFDIYKRKSIKKALKFARNVKNYKTKITKLRNIAYETLIEHHKNRDPDEIIHIGSEVLNSDISHPDILMQLGTLILENGKAELAIKLFHKANNNCQWNKLKTNVIMGRLIDIDIKNQIISMWRNLSYHNLGKAYYAIGEYRKALEYYRQISDLDSSFTEDVHADMARCYVSLHNLSEAMRILLNSYKKFSSPKLLELLKEIYKEKYGSLDRFTYYLSDSSNFQNSNEHVKNIKLLSNYKGKIIIFALHRSSCYECNKIIEVLAKLESLYENDEEIVFINLYERNEPKLNMKSIMVDNDLFNRLTKELNVPGVPYTFIIDKEGNIKFRMAGFKKNVNIFADIKARIEILSEV